MKNISIFDYYSDDENFISSRGIPTQRERERKFPQEKLDFSYQHAKKREKKPKKQINNIEKRTHRAKEKKKKKRNKKEIIIIHAM